MNSKGKVPALLPQCYVLPFTVSSVYNRIFPKLTSMVFPFLKLATVRSKKTLSVYCAGFNLGDFANVDRRQIFLSVSDCGTSSVLSWYGSHLFNQSNKNE